MKKEKFMQDIFENVDDKLRLTNDSFWSLRKDFELLLGKYTDTNSGDWDWVEHNPFWNNKERIEQEIISLIEDIVNKQKGE
tara:strand:- start:247 stop:489 length:243 start_codon:yes stop_codon:yes gene_type:complete